MKQLEPSLLAFDTDKIPQQLEQLKSYSDIKTIHYDVMDGYVNNSSFDVEWLSTIIEHGFNVNVHLMVYNPIEWIDRFCKFNISTLTFQFEAIDANECINCLKEIKKYGVKCGIAIHPNSTPNMYEQLLSYVDIITIMTVEPGKGGQSFMPEALSNLKFVHKFRKDNKLSYLIEVDGGIKIDNVQEILKECDYIVSGTGFMKLDETNKINFLNKVKEHKHE